VARQAVQRPRHKISYTALRGTKIPLLPDRRTRPPTLALVLAFKNTSTDRKSGIGQWTYGEGRGASRARA
jgi:hypothetical protein